MSSREANIDRLNLAIATLSEDAEDMHGLILKSVDGLEDATAAGNRAADNAELIIRQLTPLTQLLDAQHRDSVAMLEEAKKASDEQRAMTEATCTDLRKTVNDSFDGLEKAQNEAFEEFRAKTIKEQERTRDELQTDLLAFKNTTSARLDALETSIAREESAVKELEGKVAESTDATTKRLLVPLYIAIAIGVINLVCLVMLLMR